MNATRTRTARTNNVVVIGGGQAGLALSRCLADRSIHHVVRERAEVADSWTTERWDSLRLLTPTG
jgi:putative flavoprotein involved in K+ transport